MDLELQLINVSDPSNGNSIKDRIDTWFVNNLEEDQKEIFIEEIDRMMLRCRRLIRWEKTLGEDGHGM